MKKNVTTIFKWVLSAIIGGVFLLFFSLISGCEVLKGKKSSRIDTIAVSKIDTGYLNKINSENKTNWDWFRTTYKFNPDNPRDTNIINNYYQAQKPEVVVVEGGHGASQTIVQQIDSGWRQKYDSLRYSKVEEIKDKKSGTPTTLLIFIGFGILILFGVLGLVILSKTHTSIKSLQK